jgi:transposase
MSRADSTDVLTPRQLTFIAERLAEPPHALTGRPRYSNRDLLPGILRVLRSGCRWRDLDRPGQASGVTHWRRLRYCHRRRGYRQVWRTLLTFCAGQAPRSLARQPRRPLDSKPGIHRANRLLGQAPGGRYEAGPVGRSRWGADCSYCGPGQLSRRASGASHPGQHLKTASNPARHLAGYGEDGRANALS